MELFDELRGAKDKVSLSAVKSWGDVKDLLENELISEEQFDDVVSEVLGGQKQLSFEQFYELLSKLDELVEDPDEGMDGVDGVAEGSSTAGTVTPSHPPTLSHPLSHPLSTHFQRSHLFSSPFILSHSL